MPLINLDDYEKKANTLISQSIFDFIGGGADDEITVKRNKLAFNEIELIPHVLHGISNPDMSTSVLGLNLSMPIIIAPMAFQSLVSVHAEITITKAAENCNVGNILSMLNTSNLDLIVKSSNNSLWFQLYLFKDKDLTIHLLKKIESAGYKAIVLTVDVPIMGKRERDIRNQFNLPNIKHFNKYLNINREDDISVKNFTDQYFQQILTWYDVEWIKNNTNLPIILKGVMRVDDALKAIDYGIAGIIVSNHGGRQLDTMPSAIEVLPSIAEKIQGKIAVLIDGGFRRGTHIFKALALGADCILIGRPILWGLIVNKIAGVEAVLEILRTELKDTMILCGYKSVEDIKKNGSACLSIEKRRF